MPLKLDIFKLPSTHLYTMRTNIRSLHPRAEPTDFTSYFIALITALAILLAFSIAYFLKHHLPHSKTQTDLEKGDVEEEARRRNQISTAAAEKGRAPVSIDVDGWVDVPLGNDADANVRTGTAQAVALAPVQGPGSAAGNSVTRPTVREIVVNPPRSRGVSPASVTRLG